MKCGLIQADDSFKLATVGHSQIGGVVNNFCSLSGSRGLRFTIRERSITSLVSHLEERLATPSKSSSGYKKFTQSINL